MTEKITLTDAINGKNINPAEALEQIEECGKMVLKLNEMMSSISPAEVDAKPKLAEVLDVLDAKVEETCIIINDSLIGLKSLIEEVKSLKLE